MTKHKKHLSDREALEHYKAFVYTVSMLCEDSKDDLVSATILRALLLRLKDV